MGNYVACKNYTQKEKNHFILLTRSHVALGTLSLHLSLLLQKQYKLSEHMDLVKSQAASQTRGRQVTTNFSPI